MRDIFTPYRKKGDKMLLEFLQINLTEIITVVTGALVGGQGFFILFKNLKTNKNIDLIDKTVNKLVSGDLKDVASVVKEVTDLVPEILEEFKTEMFKVINDFKKELNDQQIKVIDTFENKVNQIETVTKNEINRLNAIIKLEVKGDKNENVSGL